MSKTKSANVSSVHANRAVANMKGGTHSNKHGEAKGC